MSQTQPAKRRSMDLDMLRIFATLLVIFNHTKERGFFRFVQDEPGTPLFWFNLFFSIFCKVAVPLFFMISGATLLGKQESVGRTYKRTIRILVDIVVFSLLFYELDALQSGVPLTLRDFIKGITQTNVDHLWFLYSYIAFLLAAPVLRGLVRGFKDDEFLVLFVLAVAIGYLLPMFEFVVAPIKRLITPVWVITMTVLFPVMGYYFSHRFDLAKLTGKRLALLWVINLAVLASSEVMEYYFLQRSPGSIDELFLTNNRYIFAPVVYLTFRKLFDGVSFSERASKVWTEVSICTFGIYLIHPVFMEYVPGLVKLWDTFETGGFIRNEFGVVLTVLCTFVISLAVAFVVRRIPVLKKLF